MAIKGGDDIEKRFSPPRQFNDGEHSLCEELLASLENISRDVENNLPVCRQVNIVKRALEDAGIWIERAIDEHGIKEQ